MYKDRSFLYSIYITTEQVKLDFRVRGVDYMFYIMQYNSKYKCNAYYENSII